MDSRVFVVVDFLLQLARIDHGQKAAWTSIRYCTFLPILL